MANYGLIGKNIAYSFSKKYFTEKFEKEKLAHRYHNFDIETLALFKKIIQKETIKMYLTAPNSPPNSLFKNPKKRILAIFVRIFPVIDTLIRITIKVNAKEKIFI